eukprot:jgi/Mesvir1/22779/Mv14169-RA.1
MAELPQDASGQVFTPNEMEFFAEDELIEIVPNFRMDALSMLSGTFGPFRPQLPIRVPLWLAISLRKRHKCTIRPPEWMNVESLMETLALERENARAFQPLPFAYLEVATLLHHYAAEDIEDSYKVHTLVEDVRAVRFSKVEAGLGRLQSAVSAVKLNNLAACEVNTMRPFITKSLRRFLSHDPTFVAAPPESAAAEEAPAAPPAAAAPPPPAAVRVLRRGG